MGPLRFGLDERMDDESSGKTEFLEEKSVLGEGSVIAERSNFELQSSPNVNYTSKAATAKSGSIKSASKLLKLEKSNKVNYLNFRLQFEN